MANRPIIVAHRGLHHDFPENSLEALAAAFAAGISAVEFDVRLTADRVPILMHDDTLERMTTAKGHVAASTWAELQKDRLRHRDLATNIAPQRLEDAFAPGVDPKIAAVDPADRLFVVELKVFEPALVREVLDYRRKIAGAILLQSFDSRVIEEAMSLDPNCDVAILCGDADELETAVKSKCRRVNMSHRLLTSRLVSQLRSDGRLVGAWTANTEVEIRGVLAIGVEMVITDEPMLTRQIIAESQR